MDQDLVVVGGGLAGLSAALYGARLGLSTLIVESEAAGGQVVTVESIRTYPGFPDGVNGADLALDVQAQAESAGAEMTLANITAVRPIEGGFELADDDGAAYTARAVVMAVGSSRRTLNIPGETELSGRGVSRCAACDAFFFVGKRVAVVGGGDSALDEARVLAERGVSEILVVNRDEEFSAQEAIISTARAEQSIQLLGSTELLEIRGGATVEEIVMRAGTGERVEAVDGVFVYAGLVPNTAWLADTLELDATGHVVTDRWLQTSTPGIYAAGDVRQDSAAQLVAAAGDGATAAVAAGRYLQHQQQRSTRA